MLTRMRVEDGVDTASFVEYLSTRYNFRDAGDDGDRRLLTGGINLELPA